VDSGLAKLGYIYVNVDDCWAYSRDSNGKIQWDPNTFPNGMKALGDYIHSKGLKYGIYSSSSPKTCAGRPGSLGYEKQDAESYASWGVDYLKFDNCGAPASYPPTARYPVMRDALNATGRQILYSLCEWGSQNPWDWAQPVGNSWRTTNDIQDEWNNLLRVLDNNIGLSYAARPGAWNDPDMLEVGNGGMTVTEYQSHFFLWALLKAPLLIGCDLTKMSTEIFDIFTAEEVIAVNQDKLGVQGDLVWQKGPMQVWAGPLSGGSFVVVVFNRHTPADQFKTSVEVKWNMIGLKNGTKALVRDLFGKKDIGTFTDSFTVDLLTHASGIFKITPNTFSPEYEKWRPYHASQKYQR